MRVYVSSVHSGPNPSPGVGISRSIKDQFPEAELVAVDYSAESSGIHYDKFDRVEIFRPWDELDIETHVSHIDNLLNTNKSQCYWIPGSDLEAEFLADHIDSSAALVPPVGAFDATRKPKITLSETLPVSVPPSVNAFAPAADVEQFCRRHGWDVWVKGPDYDAINVSDWKSLKNSRQRLAQIWGTSDIIVQASVPGAEESVCFCAYEGKLIDSVRMKKRIQTDEGKTWAGRVEDVPSDILNPLSKVISESNWTGGAELEFIRRTDGELSLIDWNPRFPAWVHGATLTGSNLPGQLLAVAAGETAMGEPREAQGFTRVVTEVPTKPAYPLPDRVANYDESNQSSPKHPSAMPALSAVRNEAVEEQPPLADLPEHVVRDLDEQAVENVESPARIRLPRTTAHSINTASEIAKNINERTDEVEIQIAYSTKTNPSKYLMNKIKNEGMHVDVISGAELRWVQSIGFNPNKIIVNGPKGVYELLDSEVTRVAAVFADSIIALRRLVEEATTSAETVGVRINPPGEQSRFGVELDDTKKFNKLVGLLQALPEDKGIGFHLHVQASRIGTDEWVSNVEKLISWAVTIEKLTGKEIKTLDFGGGWSVRSFQGHLCDYLSEMVQSAAERLKSLSRVYIEPGKAIAKPTNAVTGSIIERRTKAGDRCEIVVDTSRASLPLSGDRARTVAVKTQESGWSRLRHGNDRILGCICMESDIIAEGVNIPREIKSGDKIVILNTGAYETSMSYSFGRGGER